MHRTIGYLSKRFVQIRPGEGRRVVLTFLYFFLIITAYYLIKPVSRSLVLGELGSRLVPYVDLVCAVLMGPVVTLFARLVDRVPKSTLVSGSFGVVIALLLGFWKLLALPAPWVAGVFYIWVAIFSVLVVTLFWLVANDLYRPREAKRLFGFIGSGGILGGIVGSSLAAGWAKVLGTENLILLSAALLCLCWLLVQELWTLTPERAAAEERGAGPPRRETFLSNVGGFVRLLLESRYLLLLVAVVGLSKLVGTLVYYQFNPFIERAFPDLDARTAFTGAFFGGMNVIAFIVQFFFTSWILRRWGIFTALLALPLGLLLGTTGLLVVPAFWL
ncbi:MAG: MFS transporter, partial [Candidatus Omnitrophica bacterium]|nr:MFS transporter [Candidatus Omnitrophota bacterium]